MTTSATVSHRPARAALPGRRVEGWRWTDLRGVLGDGPAGLEAIPEGGHVIARLAQAAGGPAAQDWSAPEVAKLELAPGEGLEASSLVVRVPDGHTLTRTIHLDGAHAASVALVRVAVELGRGATYRQFTFSTGARLSRVETDVTVSAPGAKVELAGVYLCGAGRHSDQTSRIELSAEGAEVRQIVRGAVRAGGRGVFQGRFHLTREAQKADARMAHNALLLVDGAEVFAKPELEIYADDVQCAHGNTSGQLDAAALFYLRSRGIPKAEAQAMLTRAFLLAAMPDWLPEDDRRQAESRLDAWLTPEGAP